MPAFDLQVYDVCWLGGSPCSGKSSVAAAIAARRWVEGVWGVDS